MASFVYKNFKLFNMTWVVIILVALYFMVQFLRDLNRDNNDLDKISIDNKFKIITDILNAKAFKGNGEVRLHPNDKRSFHLYTKGANQIIEFEYGTGHLVITWKLKYSLDNEIIIKETFYNVRDIQDSEQIQIANGLIKRMEESIKQKTSFYKI